MNSGTRSALESILEVQKMQIEIQSQILRELGQMKQHTGDKSRIPLTGSFSTSKDPIYCSRS
jgi:hypothetical protein